VSGPKHGDGKKILANENFGFAPESLEKHLTLANILKEQLLDPKLKKAHEAIETGEKSIGQYVLNNGVLCKKSKNTMVPDRMFQIVLFVLFWVPITL
jgi:hypothetical protein